MRYLKWTILGFVISCVFSTLVSFAYNSGYQSIVGVTLPILGGNLSAYTHLKEYDGPQYYFSAGTVDNLTGAYVRVKAKTTGGMGAKETGYITLAELEQDTWGTNATNIFSGQEYTLYLRREKSAVSTASHSGGWFIDDRLI